MTASAPPPPSPPSHPPTPATGRHAPFGWIVPCVAVAVAAGAGIGVGWLLWAGPDSTASGAGLDSAAAACQAWQRVPAFSALYNDDEDASAHFNRAVAAASLAQTAAELDDRYKALGESFQDVHMRLRTYEVEGAEAEAAHEKVTTLCADLDG